MVGGRDLSASAESVVNRYHNKRVATQMLQMLCGAINSLRYTTVRYWWSLLCPRDGCEVSRSTCVYVCHVCSVLLATPWTYFLHLCLSSVILIDFSTERPVHDLMLSIQAVRGLPPLRTPGIVPCIISFSRQFACFLAV